MADSDIPENRRYVQNAGEDALGDFLQWLDTSGNNVITANETEGVIIKVLGYSWGGVSAIGFTQKLSTTGTIVIGGSPHGPISYRLDVPIAIEVLFTIDPVRHLNPPGTVPSTVQNFYNYYQRRGGYGIFRYTDGVMDREVGNAFSALLLGVEVDTAAQSSIQVMVDVIYPSVTRSGEPYAPDNPIELILRSSEVNHDVMPWYARPDALDAME